MTVTLSQVIRRIQRWIEPKDSLVWSTPTGGSTTTLIDANVLAGGASRGSQMFEFAWVAFYGPTPNRTQANRFRRVIEGGDNATTGTLTFAPAISGAVVATETYAIWTQAPPEFIERAIDSANSTMEFIERSQLTVVADARVYALNTDAPWITRPEQILSIELRPASATAADVPTAVLDWDWDVDHNAYGIRLPRSYTPSVDTLTLISTRSYYDLDGTIADATWTGTCPDAEWLAAETVLRLAAEDNVSLPDGRLQRVAAVARRYRRAYGVRANRPMFAREMVSAGPPGQSWGYGGSPF